MTNTRPTLHTSLAGVRIGLLADASPEIGAIEEALIDQGAFIERIHPDAHWWANEPGVDLAIVRVEHPPTASAPDQLQERRRTDLLQALVRTERVIALLDEPLETSLGTLCEFVLPPFGPAEVISRIFRVLKEPRPSASIGVGNVELNIANRIVIVDGRVIDLTFNEFEIFRILLAANGGVLSREELNRRLGGDEAAQKSRRIDIHIHRLRMKLQGMTGASLDTVRNVGYRLTVSRIG